MKIDDIDAFVATVRCQSISLAAEALQLTQSAITRRVQNFEEELGIELLDRTTKPPRPNPMGKVVYEQCRVVLREVSELRDMVSNEVVPAGTFRLGITQAIGDVILLDALKQLKQTFPDLSTQVATGWGTQLVAKVANGEMDAAAALFPSTKVLPDNVIGETLGRVELVVVAAKGTMTKRSYKLKDCHTFGWVLSPDGCGFRAVLQRALTGQGLSFKIGLESFGADLQMGLVAAGLGLGFMPLPQLERSTHRDKLDIISISDFKPILDIWLIQSRLPTPLQQAVDFFSLSVANAFADKNAVVNAKPRRQRSA
ncbi:LysR family transcriptional regulator [Glaciimonas immobilis]|uniref:DNA-binding transcriptional LysR family regulator n=1 Tax=Glaciimonas immobilis TaxID=728004 RepID=A0A840RT88_9BURK|nr:LysR family transcriptional regulator [Glaciimonas immobilis]KAF3999707.1 LysR family transcriptional regulator [Glaciimonas immobilis]MBB5200156.1 DNA-binding transcriptional LysR family regulator [Glaciimonas immobilis]